MSRRSAKVLTTHIECLKAEPGEYRVGGTEDDTPGLLFIVNKASGQSFAFRYISPLNRKPRRMGLGAFPTLSLAKARETAAMRYRDVVNGIDPLAAKDERKRALTVTGLCDQWLAATSETRASHAEDQRMVSVYIESAIGSIPADALTRRVIGPWFRELTTDRGPVQANRVLTTLRTVYNWALNDDLIAANPTQGIKKNREYPRERVLTTDEIFTLWQGLDREDVTLTVRCAFRLQLLTACRIGEVLGAAKKEFDLTRGLWKIPGRVKGGDRRTKNSKAHERPLSPLAVDIIKGAMAASGDSPWLFPGVISGKPVRRDTLKDEAPRLTRLLGMDEWSSHDLRRTVCTNLGEQGADEQVIKAIMNHAKQDVTGKHYNHAKYRGPICDALMKWETRLREIIEGREPGGNVVPFTRAA